jgi:soluble lytic murein transglycosylase-like protein
VMARNGQLVSAVACFTVCVALAAAPRGVAAATGDVGLSREQEPATQHVHQQLAARMPRLAAEARHALARTILAEAALARVDPLLLVALIHVESRFDPRAESNAGAVGLMQLRTPTFQGELARHRLPAADPRDPVANVQAGTRYLRRLLDAFGDVDVALMAYNAGPNRILSHLRAGEIPERFHAYPRRIRGELARIRTVLRAQPLHASRSSSPPLAAADLGAMRAVAD